MTNYEKFHRIINGSIEYKMNVGGELTITSYYKNEKIRLDLSRMDEDMFNELVVGVNCDKVIQEDRDEHKGIRNYCPSCDYMFTNDESCEEVSNCPECDVELDWSDVD